VIFHGRLVAEIPVADADEATLLRAAYDLKADAPMPEEVAAEMVAAEAMSAEAISAEAISAADVAPDPADAHPGGLQ
jgi:hypothetical protein